MPQLREQEVGTTDLLGPGGNFKEELRRSHVYNCGAIWDFLYHPGHIWPDFPF